MNNTVDDFRHFITVTLLEGAARAWAEGHLKIAERLTDAAWSLVGTDDFIDDEHQEQRQ
jgi:hypothetical protein